MQISDAKLLPPAARKVLALSAILTLVITIAVTGLLYLILSAFNVPPLVLVIARCLWGFIFTLLVFNCIAQPTVAYKRYRYLIREDLIAVRYGVLTVTREYLPMRRLQKVHVESGPVNRLFGLADIELYSAGGTLSIRCLPEDEANDIAESLNRQINALIAEGEVAARV